VNKQKGTFPIDTDFSEKALIIDIQRDGGKASRETGVESRGQLKK
jgi:hypothetical protein